MLKKVLASFSKCWQSSFRAVQLQLGQRTNDMGYEEIEVTIGGESRKLRCVVFDQGRRANTPPVGAFQKRQGQKIWVEQISLFKQQDGTWKVSQGTTILNRAGYRLLGWADKIVSAKNESQHAGSMRKTGRAA